MQPINFNKRLGYYIVGDQEFESKIAAALYSVKVNKPMTWIFNDKVFALHNWQQEPEESLDDLYDKRARQIRNKYDYVIISYSGGADSHNMLMSFIRQNLHVDEILVNTTEKANRLTVNDASCLHASNAGAEHELQAVPRLKELAPLIPKTKITVLDLSDYVFANFEQAKDASWVLDKKEGLNPAGVSRFNYLYYSEVRKTFDKDKKIALVLGIEKPKVTIENGNVLVRFIDRIANIVTVTGHVKDYTNTTIEFFYWSPECVPMLIKQGHVVKKWLEANPQFQPDFYADNVNFEKIRLVHERVLRSVVYSTWDNSWFQADKAVSDWYTEFDTWFIEGYKDTKAFHIWNEGINFVRDSLAEYHREVDGPPDGLKGYAKYYNLGPLRVYPK
jgi:hypothetical protein